MDRNPLDVYLKLFATKTTSRTESDVQANIAAFLTFAEIGLDVSQVSKTEEQLGDGTQRRIDIAYGKLVIEVKKDLAMGKTVEKTESQLFGYLDSRERVDGIAYAGIITDGRLWLLYSRTGELLQRVDSYSVAPDSADASERLAQWLQTILLTGERLRVTPERIIEKLGTESPRYKLHRARLRQLYSDATNQKELLTKRGLWARLLRTALGTAFEDSLDLFIDHTLIVVEAEIIAHLVLGVNPNEHDPRAVVSGAVFRESGIFNVVAEDFFDWVADSPEGEELVRSLTQELRQFDWSMINHDVLKSLYEAVIDKETRKSLGEYYTPDWLAEKVIDSLDIDWCESRTMDPACGSGTFIFHAVRRFITAGESRGWSNEKVLEELQSRVFGLDIHPVSVVLARVTFLLAIGSERLADRGSITVPVYLGDSIQWTMGANLMGSENLRVEVETTDLASSFNESTPTLFSTESHLDFPVKIISDPANFDRLVSEFVDLAQTVTDLKQKIPNAEPILKRYGVTDPKDVATLLVTFKSLCTLNAEGRDHIWGYFVRNQVKAGLVLPAGK